jgi:chlorobactene glucosyltransferase
MITALVLAAAAPLATMLAIALVNLGTAPRLRSHSWPLSKPRVSLLVPARDEADQLATTLPSMIASDYPDLEIVVLDDHSTDDTAEITGTLAALHPERLRMLRGRPLPAGWTGKNWACHQLAEAATGDILIFCDADVRITSGAVRRTVAALTGARVDLLTALPAQRLRGAAANAVVPLVMHVAIAATLPLALLPRLRGSSTTIANGQWLALRRSLYTRLGGHEAIRAEIVEDMALGRAARRAGARVLAVIASHDIETEMYRGAEELRAGFTKNLYLLAGGTPARFGAVLVAFLLTMALPLLLPVVDQRAISFLPLALLLATRVVIARTFHHGLLPVLLHPLGVVLLTRIALASAAAARRGTIVWKGRNVAAQRAG